MTSTMKHFTATRRRFTLSSARPPVRGRFVELLTKRHFSDMQVRMAQFFRNGIRHGTFRRAVDPGLCSLSLIAILMFHFTQGRVVQQLSAAGAANISSRNAIHAHIMSLFTRY